MVLFGNAAFNAVLHIAILAPNIISCVFILTWGNPSVLLYPAGSALFKCSALRFLITSGSSSVISEELTAIVYIRGLDDVTKPRALESWIWTRFVQARCFQLEERDGGVADITAVREGPW